MKRLLAPLSTGALLTLLSSAPSLVYAHEMEAATSYSMSNKELLYLLVGVVGLLGFVLLVLALALILLVQYHAQRNYNASALQLPSISLLPDFGKLWAWFSGARAKGGTGAKADLPLDHSYDGITELDNAAPPLFTWILYGTMLFAVVYMLNYHVFEWSPNQEEEYQIAMEEAAKQKEEWMKLAANQVDETNVEYTDDPARLAEGQEIFMANCSPCHGQKMEGITGPNLVDPYWVHGGGPKNIFKTIKYGVPEKGMISWQSQLSPAQMASVVSFIISQEGTNPPNPKAPEGEKWVPEAEEAAQGEGAAEDGMESATEEQQAEEQPTTAEVEEVSASAANATRSQS